MEKEKGSVLGGILLIAGCCIGAGMLGLPALSAMAGFIPSTGMLILSWIFMLTTGLLLLEVNLHFEKEVSFATMAQKTLGNLGKNISWITFLFLFYCLLVAYVSASGGLIAGFLEQSFGISISSIYGSFMATLLLAILLYYGTKITDYFNRLFMFGLIGSYVALIILGAPYLTGSLLKHKEFFYTPYILPAMIVSFGFHNLVPTMKNYFEGDVRRLKTVLIIGSFIPLVVYIIWEALILGLIPLEKFRDALDQGQIATESLRQATQNTFISYIAMAFAFFAIVTSFIGVALSFVDFLSDGLKLKKMGLKKLFLITLVLAPPFFFALIYPKLFLVALNYAGGIGAVILFGILPPLMAWKMRNQKDNSVKPIIPGGKIVLISVIIFSVAIIIMQINQEMARL